MFYFYGLVQKHGYEFHVWIHWWLSHFSLKREEEHTHDTTRLIRIHVVVICGKILRMSCFLKTRRRWKWQKRREGKYDAFSFLLSISLSFWEYSLGIYIYVFLPMCIGLKKSILYIHRHTLVQAQSNVRSMTVKLKDRLHTCMYLICMKYSMSLKCDGCMAWHELVFVGDRMRLQKLWRTLYI